MGDIFKNKFFIILLIVICVLTLSTIILNLAGYGSVVADVTNIILMPFQMFGELIRESFSGFTAYFTEFNHMKEEITELKEQLDSLEAYAEYWRGQAQENEMLHSFYGLKIKRPDYDFQPAKITARDPGNYSSGFTINKGFFEQIAKDMPVIAVKGMEYAILGYISEAGGLSSKVVSFTRAGSYIGAYIQRTEEIGIVEGTFELDKKGLCRLVNLSKDVIPEVGDKVYSSGEGTIYPEDLYIGEIIEVIPDPVSHTMTAIIKPAVDLNEIRDVMVIRGFERNFY